MTAGRWTCSAQVDLLGFADLLMAANWDTRSQIGRLAIQRISRLTDAVRLFEKERAAHPNLYPEHLYSRRFNDTLFLGVDVEGFNPPEGRTTQTGGYSIAELKKDAKLEGPLGSLDVKGTSAAEVAKLVGLVARIHMYVDSRDRELGFPGCRTVVATGLRGCVTDSEEQDDYFSANLSVSIAFEADKQGGSAGLAGNHIYVEDDVGVAISYCHLTKAMFAYAKFLPKERPLVDPYQFDRPPEQADEVGILPLPRRTWDVSEPLTVEILRKPCSFRRLNPAVLSNLQFFRDYERVAQGQGMFERELLRSLHESTPTIESVRKSMGPTIGIADGENVSDYVMLRLKFELDDDYDENFKT